MVGYVTSTQEEVSVQSDFTTRLNFTMTEATLEAAEMVVTARRPPVEPDKTTSRYVVDIFDIQSVPLARDTDDLLELQPGVSVDGNVRLRGSDTAADQLRASAVLRRWTASRCSTTTPTSTTSSGSR